jgi:hypothetical protein
MCVPCTSLSQRAEYAQNEQYVNGTEAEGGTCATRCIDGFYRDQTDQYCKRCWTAQELILAAGPGFFTVLPCTDTLNTQLDQCLEKAGSTITGHDLEMRGDCPRVCSQGWRPLINASGSFCEQCPWPFDVEGGTVHTTALKWHVPDDPCRMHCLLPYRLAADRLTRKSTQDTPLCPHIWTQIEPVCCAMATVLSVNMPRGNCALVSPALTCPRPSSSRRIRRHGKLSTQQTP